MQSSNYIVKANEKSGLKRRSKSCSAFTMVEVILAIGIMAIGLLGTLVLFPVGLDATRTASDNTEMATIAAEYISKYQQAAMNTNNYLLPGPGLNPDVLQQTEFFQTITNDSGVYFKSRILVTNWDIFAQITYNRAGIRTNTISRVVIDLWRPGGSTNTFVTEVARYALP